MMQSDFYEIRLASIVSNVDKDVLVELYQPIIGANATILYLTLLKQKRNEDDEITYAAQDLLNLMQLDPNAVLSARHFLEAVGLMRSYMKQSESGRYFIYVLYAPKSPKDFFDDVLFKGLLIQSIGEKQAKKLAFKYRVNLSIDESFKEETVSFVDVFHPDYDDTSFMKNIGGNIVGHDAGREQIRFNNELFLRFVEDISQIKSEAITKKDLKEISRLATLFGLNESQMSFIVAEEYDPHKYPHLDFNRVKYVAETEVKFKFIDQKPKNTISDIHGNLVMHQKIRDMESIPPAEYLKLKRGNVIPPMVDLETLNNISRNYPLVNGVINAIIDYVLEKNDNNLPYFATDKIASQLASKRIETTYDAMNELQRIANEEKEKIARQQQYKSSSLKNNKTEISEIPSETKPEKPVLRSEPKEIVSDEEIDLLFKSLEEKKKGGK